MISTSPHDILRLLAGEQEGVLITLVGIEGSSSRAVGTQMAVMADGGHAGSFSGGCIEAAVVAEALSVLNKGGAGRVVRYGSGSPYIDIRLPCGGGIDLLFTPRPDRAVLNAALDLLAQRQPVAVAIDAQGVAIGSRGDGAFVRRYDPLLRLAAVGQGEDLAALARLAAGFGIAVDALVPDRDSAAPADMPGITLHRLHTTAQLPTLSTDPWTAVVFLFHDRDWEEFLLPQALALPAFYHGAIGSARTHRARIAALQAAGVPAASIATLRGTIGLIPATRDPATLALSILAEVVQDYQACAGRDVAIAAPVAEVAASNGAP
jgi:xanthine dehydrogenase accessory factor